MVVVYYAAMRQSAAQRLKYASRVASIANGWKKWQGESLGIERLHGVEQKMEQERRFQRWADSKPLYRDVLPANWVLYKIMTFVQAPTFELFVKNMGQLMMEKITNADMLVFNRCTPELKEALRARNLRMVNRRADIYLADNDGNSEDYLTGNECPFDMTPDLIDIPDDDYGVWYVDVMDHLDRWDGKRVHMKLLMCHSKKFPGVHCPGRFVMTCCENDIQFVGVVAKGKDLKAYKNRDWVDVTATVRKEYIEAYQGEGPVLYVDKITTCAKPAQEVVSF